VVGGRVGGGRFGEGLGVPVDADDNPALGQEAFGHGQAHPAGGAGHDGDAACAHTGS
jgi:hypothetical protein